MKMNKKQKDSVDWVQIFFDALRNHCLVWPWNESDQSHREVLDWQIVSDFGHFKFDCDKHSSNDRVYILKLEIQFEIEITFVVMNILFEIELCGFLNI